MVRRRMLQRRRSRHSKPSWLLVLRAGSDIFIGWSLHPSRLVRSVGESPICARGGAPTGPPRGAVRAAAYPDRADRRAPTARSVKRVPDERCYILLFEVQLPTFKDMESTRKACR